MADLPLKRNRYLDPGDDTFECSFASRNLSEDFQTFHLRAARTERQGMFGPGIVSGLAVSGAVGSSQITVEPGVAVDHQGRLIVLASQGMANLGTNPAAGENQEVEVPVMMELAPLAQAANATYYLTIEFSEINRFDEGTDCGRLEQVPWLRMQPTSGDSAFAGAALVLAVVTVDTTGQLVELVPGQSILPFQRQPLGQSLGQLDIHRAVLLGDQVQESPAGALAPSDGGGLELSPVGGPLTISGALGLGSGVTVNAFSDDPGIGGGDTTVPTAAAVKTYVDGLIAAVNGELATKAVTTDVNLRLGQLEDAIATKANLGGSGSQDFLTEDLQVRGLLTTLNTLEVGGDLRLRGSHIRDAGNTARITVTDNGVLQLREDNGSVALTVSTAGGVTIGNNSSSQNTVNGRLTVTGDLYLNGRDIRDTGGTARITINDNGTLQLRRASGSVALTVNTNNTTAIYSHLHVGGDIQLNGQDILDSGGNSRISIYNGGTLRLRRAGGHTALAVDTSGRIGLGGLTNPASPLHVYSSNNPTVLRIQSSGAFGRAGIDFWSDPRGSSNEWRPASIRSTDRGGFVGGLAFYVNGVGFANRTRQRRILTLENDYARVSGRLLVNTVPFRNKRNLQWDDATREICYDNSTKRCKENIRPLEDDFTQLLTLEPKTYTRPDRPDDWEIGYIAEEMHDAGLERLVFYDQKGLPEAINYPKVCMYLTEIVKDLTQRLGQLEQQTG